MGVMVVVSVRTSVVEITATTVFAVGVMETMVVAVARSFVTV
jgi:hypothetical protein